MSMIFRASEFRPSHPARLSPAGSWRWRSRWASRRAGRAPLAWPATWRTGPSSGTPWSPAPSREPWSSGAPRRAGPGALARRPSRCAGRESQPGAQGTAAAESGEAEGGPPSSREHAAAGSRLRPMEKTNGPGDNTDLFAGCAAIKGGVICKTT